MTRAFSTLFLSSPTLLVTTAACNTFVFDTTPTPVASPELIVAEPIAGEPDEVEPGEAVTPVAAFPAVFATPSPMLMTSATCSTSTLLLLSAVTMAVWTIESLCSTPCAVASPSSDAWVLLVPVLELDVVPPPELTPAIAPTDAFAPEFADALPWLQTAALSVWFCSSAVADDPVAPSGSQLRLGPAGGVGSSGSGSSPEGSELSAAFDDCGDVASASSPVSLQLVAPVELGELSGAEVSEGGVVSDAAVVSGGAVASDEIVVSGAESGADVSAMVVAVGAVVSVESVEPGSSARAAGTPTAKETMQTANTVARTRRQRIACFEFPLMIVIACSLPVPPDAESAGGQGSRMRCGKGPPPLPTSA